MSEPSSLEIIDALIAFAARNGLGEDVPWEDIEIAISQLLDHPVAQSDLRGRMNQLNDPEVALTLADWFDRAADARDKDARDAARPSEKVLGPFQAVGFGSAGTAVILTATGALTLGAGLLIGVAALTFAGSVTFGRSRLSKREDVASADARKIRRLADIARKRGERG